MIVAFASNQVMVAKGDGAGTGASMVITTDPVPMNGMNRASAIMNIHSILDAGSQTPQLTATAQVSNDGVNWVDDGPVVVATTSGAQAIKTADTEGQFVRFQYTLEPEAGASGSDYTFMCFDLHVRLDHT